MEENEPHFDPTRKKEKEVRQGPWKWEGREATAQVKESPCTALVHSTRAPGGKVEHENG